MGVKTNRLRAYTPGEPPDGKVGFIDTCPLCSGSGEVRRMEPEAETVEVVTTHRYVPAIGCSMKVRVVITAQHAYSLSKLVEYFKEVIGQAEIPTMPGRSDELTTGYCDELLEDLGAEESLREHATRAHKEQYEAMKKGKSDD